MTIKFNVCGTMSYIDTHLSTEEEMEKCCKIRMTSEDEWRPYSIYWKYNKEAYKYVDPDFNKTKVKSTKTMSLIVRQLDSVTGNFRGLCCVVTSSMALGEVNMSIWPTNDTVRSAVTTPPQPGPK